MTKSKNSMDMVAFTVIVIESTFSLLHLGRHLLPITTLNRHLSRNSSKQECIPVGCIPPAHWPYAMHAPLPHMPPYHACAPCYTCPPATHKHPWHAHLLPYMPPAMHALLPCTPPAIHAPLPHISPLPCMPPLPPPPPPWTEFLTHASENITLPQLHCRR